jgi:integrase
VTRSAGVASPATPLTPRTRRRAVADGTSDDNKTVITVNHVVRIGSPKTAKGRRTVVLDPGTVAALREHRQRQLAERLLMGAGFTDHGLVFAVRMAPRCTRSGSRGRSTSSPRAGLPRIRLHDLRHTWATLALSTGVHPKVVQDRLGMPRSGSRSTCTATSPRAAQRRRIPCRRCDLRDARLHTR